MKPLDRSEPRIPRPPERARPFTSGERAWLWAAACLSARREGRTLAHDATRPCLPETILRCLNDLYRDRMIDMVDARVLRDWGDRGRAPDPRWGASHSDWQQWRHATAALDHVLRARGIVAGFDLSLPKPMPRKAKILPEYRITFTFDRPNPVSNPSQES